MCLRSRFATALLIALSLLPAAANGGQFNANLNIGDPAPAWKDLPGVDGKKHSLADLKDKPVVVVVFTCNSCPIAGDYEDRIIAFAKKQSSGDRVSVVAINVNTIEDDRLPKMKERAESKRYPFAYLYDASQKIGKAYGATFTPEFFVLDRQRKIAYMGGFDDNVEPSKATRPYVDLAVQALLKGAKPSPAETSPAAGCMIRYERARRKRRES